jgi:hypothetical protein
LCGWREVITVAEASAASCVPRFYAYKEEMYFIRDVAVKSNLFDA